MSGQLIFQPLGHKDKKILHLHSLKDFDEVEICFQRVKGIEKDLNGQSEFKRRIEDGLPKMIEKSLKLSQEKRIKIDANSCNVKTI
jgi:hypothetical protein